MNNFLEIKHLLVDNNDNLIGCPYCQSNKVIHYEKNRKRYATLSIQNCNKTFNLSSKSLFFSSKVNILAWYSFLKCILSGTSTSTAFIKAKISFVTGAQWMKKNLMCLKIIKIQSY